MKAAFVIVFVVAFLAWFFNGDVRALLTVILAVVIVRLAFGKI